MSRLKKTHLLTGANLGDRQATLQRAQALIEQHIGQVVKASALYETQAWGKTDQPDFLNQALEVVTELSPTKMLAKILAIEKELGRTDREKWEARPIDIDILFYDNKILKTSELTIPHPHLHKRNFVLIPLLEIAPNKQHPVFKKTIEALYEESDDSLEVLMLEPIENVEP